MSRLNAQHLPRYLHLPMDEKHAAPRKKCDHCNRKACQWILCAIKEPHSETVYEDWQSRCHAHRLKPSKLSEGRRIVGKDEIRVREVMAL